MKNRHKHRNNKQLLQFLIEQQAKIMATENRDCYRNGQNLTQNTDFGKSKLKLA